MSHPTASSNVLLLGLWKPILARFGLIDRSNFGSIDFGVVGPTRARGPRSPLREGVPVRRAGLSAALGTRCTLGGLTAETPADGRRDTVGLSARDSVFG